MFSIYNDDAVVFAPHTGQTHLLDSSAHTVLELISESTPVSKTDLIALLKTDEVEGQKDLLSNYISDIIDSLLNIELISNS